jgi:hypothetical protein
MIIYLSNSAESTGQQADRGLSLGRAVLALGEIIAELNRGPGDALRRKRMRGLPFGRGWREGSTVPIATMAKPGFVERSPADAFRM